MKNFKTVEERHAFESGVDYTKGYILFCLRHYVYDLLEGEVQKDLCFQRDMLEFILGKKNYIPNKYNIFFKEFCENYEKYRLKL